MKKPHIQTMVLEHATQMFLQGLELDWEEDQHLKDTPKRVARAWAEMFAVGYTQDPKEILTVSFSDDYDQMIVQKDIPFLSFCAHHMVPFSGKAKIGYLPKDRRIRSTASFIKVFQCLSLGVESIEFLVLSTIMTF